MSHRNVAPDTAIRLSRSLFERVASGQTNIFRARELEVAREIEIPLVINRRPEGVDS